MLLSQDEIDQYRNVILTDDRVARKHLTDLARNDHERFIELCHQLLQDPSEVVQRIILLLLGQQGDKHDSVAEGSALMALSHPKLQRWAFFALSRVATPAALPTLFLSAQKGIPYALDALNEQVTTDEDKKRLLQLARQLLLSQHYQLREEALNTLLKHSSAAAEEDFLLKAAQIYYDELVMNALGNATLKVLPPLEEELATLPPGTAEYHDIARAIQKLKKQAPTVDE
jgi:hypothetical protein